MSYTIRRIEQSDNAALAQVIKTALEEQGNNKPGTIYYDPLLYDMFSGYQTADAVYYVVIENGELLGGCGIARIPNQSENYCELQRMFLKKEARGKGVGAALMNKCLDFAREAGYDLVYIETFCNMTEAIRLYERSGFEYIDHPLGNTGHFSCDKFLVKRVF
ncbi:MAG: GNAT family N-acetyltransferase [Bacteroidetes bacterium]|nr:GNAT family N-acetyltransferase [Bacteroidota bacterium]